MYISAITWKIENIKKSILNMNYKDKIKERKKECRAKIASKNRKKNRKCGNGIEKY